MLRRQAHGVDARPRASRDVGARGGRAADIEPLCQLSRVVATTVLPKPRSGGEARARYRRVRHRARRSLRRVRSELACDEVRERADLASGTRGSHGAHWTSRRRAHRMRKGAKSTFADARGEPYPAHWRDRRTLADLSEHLGKGRHWRGVAKVAVVKSGQLVDAVDGQPIVIEPPAAKASDTRWRRAQ